jgi:nickel/cobalt exporter
LLFCLAVSCTGAGAGKSPFGIGDAYPRPGPAPGGITAWLLAKQAEFTRAMIAALRATRSGAGAVALITIAFLYGVFHAAGPGHGKAVVSSYVFANEQALRRHWRRVAAAILQALVAITWWCPP